MNTHTFPRARSLERGASLIEVLIGLTIGLVILTAIGTAYVNSNNLTRQREDKTQLDEPARVALNMLRNNLMRAGYVDMFDLDATNRSQAASIFVPGNDSRVNMFVRDPAAPIDTPLGVLFPGLTPVFGCDGAMNSDPNTLVTTAPPAAQTCGAASATRHTLQVAYQAVPNIATNPSNSLIPLNAATGDGLDCLQQDAPAAATPVGSVVVINRFSLAAAAGGMPSRMHCEGSGNDTPQDIAPGVEEFILRYQMSQPGTAATPQAAGGVQQSYLNATQVTASAQGWAAVTAVEICMVSATDPARGAAAPGTVALQPTRPTCQRDANGAFLPNIARAAGDSRLWRRYTAVVSLRNTVFASPL